MKLLKPYFLIAALSLLPFLPTFLSPLFPHTHDGPVHLARMAAFFQAISDGQIIPRWAGSLNYGYGTPLFIFMYPLPYYLGSLFLALGFSLTASFKLLLFGSYLLSGLFMYAFGVRFFKNARYAFILTVFYQFAPFRLVELLVRGSAAEGYTYSFLPLVLLGIVLIFEKRTLHTLALTALAVMLLVLSHNSISLVFFSIAAVFILVFSQSKKQTISAFAALGFGLLLSFYYWFPALVEHRFTYGDLFMKDIYKTHFPPLFQFFAPNFFNAQSLQTGGVGVQFGIFHVFAIVLALRFAQGKPTSTFKRIFMFAFLISGIALVLMTKLSLPLWENISLLRQFQFPWRLLAVVAFGTSILSVSYVKLRVFQNKTILLIFLGLVVMSSAFYWYPPLGFDRIDEDYFWHYPLNTTYFGEADVIWSAGPASGFPKEPIEVIDGQGIIKDYRKRTNSHEYMIATQTPVLLADHTTYFPGWRVYSGKEKIPVQFQDQNYRGLLVYSLPQGNHTIRVVFEESKTRLFADAVSAGAIFLLALSLLATTKYKLNSRRG